MFADIDACEKDGEKANENEHEGELVDNPGTANGAQLQMLQSTPLPVFGEMCLWSSGKFNHGPPRVSPDEELRKFLQEA